MDVRCDGKDHSRRFCICFSVIENNLRSTISRLSKHRPSAHYDAEAAFAIAIEHRSRAREKSLSLFPAVITTDSLCANCFR